MSGITDLKAAFAAAAPGVSLVEVRMRNDRTNNAQIIELDIVDAQGARTITETLDNGMSTSLMCAAVAKAAAALGTKVVQEEAAPAIPLAGKAAEGIAKLVSEPYRYNELNVEENLGEVFKTEMSKVMKDALNYGIGVSKDGKHIPREEIEGEIEHKGETYELAHDGSPQTLFF